MSARFLIPLGVVALAGTLPAFADPFGSGANTFTIDFVSVGNAGNPADTGGFSLGNVGYDFRMGRTEVARDWVDKALNSGLTNVTAGPWTGNQPACGVTWFEAAAFVNWLNTSTGHQAAYDLVWTGSFWMMNTWSSAQAWQLDGQNVYRNKDAYYFLPSEDEWYKAAYHKNDGVTANYWNYPTASDTEPTAVAAGTAAGSAVYDTMGGTPADVALSGGLSGYGTMGQGGNVKEWMESAYSGTNVGWNDTRASRGGSVQDPSVFLLSEGAIESRIGSVPMVSDPYLGFRVASIVPEPSAAMLILTSGFACLLGRPKRGLGERNVVA